MGDDIRCEWAAGMAGEPPPPDAPDSYKIFVKYRGGWRNAWHFETCDTQHTMPDMPNGEYVFDPRGVKGTTLSAYDESKLFSYLHTTGSAPIDPVFDNAPPAGNNSVAGPEGFSATAAA